MDNITRKEGVKKYGHIMSSVIDSIRSEMVEGSVMDGDELRSVITNHLWKLVAVDDSIYPPDIHLLVSLIEQHIQGGYGVISSLLKDESVNEIMINGVDRIYIEQNHVLREYDDAFMSVNELEDLIRMIAAEVHREINEANPIVDARTKEGYRVNGVLGNVAINGPVMTIRKFACEHITLGNLVEFGTLSEECAEELSGYVRAGFNVFISGGTSSGKTTMLSALASSISDSERVIVIEDSAEISIFHVNNIIRLECRNANTMGRGAVTMSDLIKSSLRMRPDRIIVGEVRGPEVVDMIQAMNTGHDGSLSTGHGNSIAGMLSRLETMYLMGVAVPVYSIQNQIVNAIDILVHLRRDGTGQRKLVEVAELVGVNTDGYELNYLYTRDINDRLVRTENQLVNEEKRLRLSEIIDKSIN